jgi:sensor c-di-GMP phosphodiesterase-like protein
MTKIPLTLLTGLVVAGGCVYIRTRRAAPLLRTQRPVAAEAER